MLFVSAMFFVLVMVGTLLAASGTSRSRSSGPNRSAMPARRLSADGVWDRLGLWFGIAVVLVVIAYAIPLWDLLHLTRYGSPGFKPF